MKPFEVEHAAYRDERGYLKKFYSDSISQTSGLSSVREIFVTSSRRGTIRGLHFQAEPSAGLKLVYALEGEILDVALNFQAGESYGEVHYFNLSAQRNNGVLVPKGFAHGFQVLSPFATVVYVTDHPHDPKLERGFRWDSAGIDWPLTPTVISERDTNLPVFTAHEEV